MGRYDDKVAVITGGNSGIGYAAAERLRDEGAQVVIVGRNAEKVAKAADELGVVGLTADVSDPAQLDGLYEELKRRYDKIDVLFANAGVAYFAPVPAVTEEFFDSITNINQRGLFFTLQKALPLLADGGSIVVNTSVVNQIGMGPAGVYAATKAAARNIVRSFAAELAPRNIRVNAVSPGPIETPIFGKMGIPEEQLKGMTQDFESRVPLQRLGKPEEIASAVAFLASSEAGFITGAELPIDGGMTQV